MNYKRCIGLLILPISLASIILSKNNYEQIFPFEKNNLKYQIQYSYHNSVLVNKIITKSFTKWTKYLDNVNIERVKKNEKPDIIISFQNLPPKILASTYTGHIILNQNIKFIFYSDKVPVNDLDDNPRYYFENVMMHEIGHLLGLSHSEDPESIMYSYAVSNKLSENDILNIQKLYNQRNLKNKEISEKEKYIEMKGIELRDIHIFLIYGYLVILTVAIICLYKKMKKYNFL